MKKNIAFIAVLFLGKSLLAQPKPLSSTIEKVTVFFNGAQVSRSASTPLSTGKSEWVFKNLTPNLDMRSVQVRGEGDFTVLSVTPRTNFLESATKRDTIKDLEEQLELLQERIALENNQLLVLQQEEAFLQRNQVQVMGVPNTTLKLDDFKQMADYQRIRLAEILNKRFDIQKDATKLQIKSAHLRAQLQEMNARKNTVSSEVVVVVNATSATSAKFFLNYIVPNAGWIPTYDLRVKDIASPLSMQMKANVQQATGEDWKEVKLTLSSGNPMESGLKPELQPWRLNLIKPQIPVSYNSRPIYEEVSSNFRRNPGITQVSGVVTDNNEPLPGASVVVKGTTIGTLTDVDGRFSLALPSSAHVLVVSSVGFNTKEVAISANSFNIALQESASTLSEVVVTGYGTKRKNAAKLFKNKSIQQKSDYKAEAPDAEEVVNPTTVSYDISLPYTILNDNKAQTVEIRDLDVPATYQYFVAPKLDKDAFLTAQIIDWEQYNLLSGEANLFFEGTFMGKTVLNTLTTEDTLHISLGRDKSVVVTRTKLRDFTKTKFLSDKRTDSRAFETTIRNKRGQPLSIVVEDQIPVSATKDIDVESDTSSAELDALTGKLVWKLDVPSGKDKKIKFSYTVKYPKGQRLVLE